MNDPGHESHGHEGHSEDVCVDLPYGSQILPVHAAMLHTGKLLWFAGSGNDPDKFRDYKMEARVWDPETEAIVRVDPYPSPRDLFCTGHCFLPDGRLLVAGGNRWYVDHTQILYAGLPDTFLFDPEPDPGRWRHAADMCEGRWYPTCIEIADGRILVVSGYRDHPLKFFWPPFGYMNRRTEIWSPEGGLDPSPATAGGSWTDLKANRGMRYYPRMHLLPAEEIVRVGPEPTTLLFEPSEREWIAVASAKGGQRIWGSSVLLPLVPPDYAARVMILGGSEGELLFTRAKATVEILERRRSGTAWEYEWSEAPSMSFPRRHVSATILLDGRVLVGGGGRSGNEGPVFETELFDPRRGRWQRGATCHVPRIYHSMAILLPDGRVWTGGGNAAQGVDELRIELYTPGYCQEGDRPTLEEAPREITYSATFSVRVECPAPIIEFALIRASSVTHSFNSDQRWIGLVIEHDSGNQFDLKAPPHRGIAPPGWYLITAIDEHRCPTKARWVHLE